MTVNEMLTVPEVAVDLRCSKAHVYKAIRGEICGVSALPVITMGRRKLVRRGTLEEWKQMNEKAAGDAMLPVSSEVGTVGRMKE